MITKELLKTEIDNIENEYVEPLYNLLKLLQNPNIYHLIIEDLADLTTIEERRSEETISHEELLAELRQDGLV